MHPLREETFSEATHTTTWSTAGADKPKKMSVNNSAYRHSIDIVRSPSPTLIEEGDIKERQSVQRLSYAYSRVVRVRSESEDEGRKWGMDIKAEGVHMNVAVIGRGDRWVAAFRRWK